MDMDRPPRSTRPRSLLLVIAAAMLLAVGVASADAASTIEGVWSFNGGQIAIHPVSGGKFEGTVVVETKFAECAHPVGQPIWTGMALQPDGSYFGSHYWYLDSKSTSCVENPERGRTAWRVIEAANGSRLLRVCFSTPEPGGPQPNIAPDGAPDSPSEYAAYGVTYGCVNSALTAPLPPASGAAGSKEHLTLPRPKKCLSLRRFQIHLLDPKYDPLKTVSVTIRGHKIATVRKGKYMVATIDLKGLPKGAFTVKIRATTVLGHHLSANRTYHTCIKKINQSSKHKPR
jgi:hypothetical protein